MMRREPVDLVLMDLFMPVMDGFDCTRELRRLGYQCPIIAVSATINEEACLEVGITEFLHKPITKNAVIGIVHRSLTEAKRTGSSVS